MSVSVKLNLSRLRRVLQGEKAAIDRGAKAYADAVLDLAQQLAPVDEGDLRESGEVVPGDTQGSYKVQFGRGLPDNRAIYQEFGTSKMAAQPYLTPATQHIRPLPFFARELAELVR